MATADVDAGADVEAEASAAFSNMSSWPAAALFLVLTVLLTAL